MEVTLALAGQEIGVSSPGHIPRVDDAETQALTGGLRQETQPVAGGHDAGRADPVDARHRNVETGSGRFNHHRHSVQLFTSLKTKQLELQ